MSSSNSEVEEKGIEVRTIEVGRQPLRVATTRGPPGRPPLLLFNGIGANWQLAKPFLRALSKTAAIIFDVPGIGGSPLPRLPYRPSTLARLAARLVEAWGPPDKSDGFVRVWDLERVRKIDQ